MEIQNNMKLSNNFKLSEFASNDGAETPCNIQLNLKELALNLQVLRDYVGQPIKVNSGYRSPEYNATIPGAAKNSQHIYGKAADIVIDGYRPVQVKAMIEKLISEGKMKQGGIGNYNTFTHYDIRGTKARWDG